MYATSLNHAIDSMGSFPILLTTRQLTLSPLPFPSRPSSHRMPNVEAKTAESLTSLPHLGRLLPSTLLLITSAKLQTLKLSLRPRASLLWYLCHMAHYQLPTKVVFSLLSVCTTSIRNHFCRPSSGRIIWFFKHLYAHPSSSLASADLGKQPSPQLAYYKYLASHPHPSSFFIEHHQASNFEAF